MVGVERVVADERVVGAEERVETEERLEFVVTPDAFDCIDSPREVAVERDEYPLERVDGVVREVITRPSR